MALSHYARPGSTSPPQSHFDHIDTWIFDLDNTLYSHEAGIWPQLDKRITSYLVATLDLEPGPARVLQKQLYYRHGSSLRGLIEEYRIDPHEYLEYTHDIDYSALSANAPLSRAIEALPGRKLILTNGTRKHAEAVATKLEILDHFEAIFDITAASFLPKPERRTYDTFLAQYAVEPARAAMFEDAEQNLLIPHELGMKTTLVVPKTPDPYREQFEQEPIVAGHIHHVTNDLASFLRFC